MDIEDFDKDVLSTLFGDDETDKKTSNDDHKKIDKMDRLFTKESMKMILVEMGLRSDMDTESLNLYNELGLKFIKNVFYDSMLFANHRQSDQINLNDLLKSINKYSIKPPFDWESIKDFKNNYESLNEIKNAKQSHRRLLQLTYRSRKYLDKQHQMLNNKK